VPAAATDTTEAPADTVVLDPLRANVRRSLFDPGLARSVERLEPGEALFPYRDLADWVSSRAAVQVRGYGGGGRQLLSVRGARPTGVLVLLDGLPLNDPVTGEADLSAVPLASLESATLVRGAGTARYGAGALGGALLLRSASARTSEPIARLAIGSYGAYEASGSATWSAGAPDGLGLRVQAGTRGAENDFSYENRLVEGSPRERREGADSSLRWVGMAAGFGSLRSTMRYDDLDRGVPGRLGTSAFEGDRWHEGRWSIAATAGSGSDEATGRVGLRRLAMRYTPGDGSPGSAQEALDLHAGTDAVVPGAGGVVATGRVSVERLKGDGIAGRPDRWSAGLTLRRPFGAGGERGEPAREAGFGLEPLVALDVSGGETALSPELGAWIRTGANLRAYGRIGRAFRVPTFADLHFEAAPGLRANPHLRPEKVVLDAEVGLEYDGRSGPLPLSVHFAAWSRDTRRPIVWLASSAALWSPRNLDRLSAHGLELQARLEAAERLRGLRWAFEAGLTLQRSRLGFGANRNPLPYQPDAAGRVSAELRSGRTAARLELRFTGSRTTTIAATRRLAEFTTLDARLRHRFEAGPLVVDATLGVDDITDTSYELIELFPEPGRTLRLTIDLH
jgi:iron complex outermembrane receptor protein